MKILNWNIRHGGGARVDRILNVINEQKDCDIVVLTEYRNNKNGQIIEQYLRQLGFAFIAKTDSNEKLNSVIVASKQQFKFKTFDNLKEHKQRVIKCEFNNFIIYACYFPGQDLKKYVFDFLISEIQQNIDNVIITGDINTGKHYLDEKGATFYHSGYLNEFEKHGLLDAWRHINKNNTEYTWYSNSGNGFRIDHYFIDEKLKDNIKNCYYIHQYREEKISDHSMMILNMEH